MADDERVETESMPLTEPYKPAFDTGIHQKVEPEPIEPEAPPRRRRWWHRRSDAAEKPDQPVGGLTPAAYTDAPPSEAIPTSSIAAPDRYQYVKWWKLLLVIFAAWVGAAQVGLSLFYWWYHTIDKTAAVYVLLIYVVACTVGGLMLSMVQGRPLITSLSLGVMSGPFASVAAAAPLYGYYYCERVGHCLIGVIPY